MNEQRPSGLLATLFAALMRNFYYKPANTSKRLALFRIGIISITAIFGLQLIYIQGIDAKRLNAESLDRRSVDRTISALRGTIYDDSGEVLAKSVYQYNITAIPRNVGVSFTRTNPDGSKVTVTKEQAVNQLATVLQMDPAEILQKITGTSLYALIAKRVDASVYQQVVDLHIPWLSSERLVGRVYPNGAVAGALLGWVNQDGVASAGVERQMDECLAGVDGKESYEKGQDGIRIPTSAIVTQKAQNGRDVVLTINRDLQYYTQQVVTAQTNYLKADWGTAVVLEVATGKILAAAEAPTMDPNDYGAAPEADRHARVFETAFEPGSVIKTVTAATLVDQGLATPSTQVVAPFGMTLPNSGGYKVTDSHFHGNDKLTLAGVLRDSSNTGIMKLGVKAPLSTRYTYLQKFGLGSKPGTGFPGESSGLLPILESWDGVKKYVSMFGQGIAQTPLQTAMMYQAIANNGVRLHPRLVEGCMDDSGNLVELPVKPGVTVVTPAAARSTIDMLEKVVEQGGIGKTAAVPGYRVGGKTGTAQIIDPNTGRYGGLHAVSFIGMAPAENPKYVVAVTFFKSRTKSNSIGATPAFKSIMEQVLRTYRVPPSTSKSANIPTTW